MFGVQTSLRHYCGVSHHTEKIKLLLTDNDKLSEGNEDKFNGLGRILVGESKQDCKKARLNEKF